jgi:glycosyltransferase involved in cell wall biosynthesis
MTRTQDCALKEIDKIVYLNPYHRGLSKWWPDSHTAIIPIGVEMIADGEVERNPAQVFYASHPNRGLDELRAVWPTVKHYVPEAVLKAAWWEESFYRPADEQLGIMPMFRTDQAGLVKLAQESGVFAYPCTCAPEISPAITIIAQLGGAYPVVIEQGGMVDTVKYGIKVSQNDFTQDLIGVLYRSIHDELDLERREMSAWAAEKYNWKSVANAWIDLIKAGVQ